MPKSLEKDSPCKVNLLLNILGKRADGFHELETVMHPIEIFDRLGFEKAEKNIELSCSDANLPTDSRNLVYRAADAFLKASKISTGVRIHLEKRIPMAAGLGGGSGNAASTLLGLNELFEKPLELDKVTGIASSLGSDVPFFLQKNPALGTGRGENVKSLEPFRAMRGAAFVLIHPGFGISTPWAYQELANFPAAQKGRPGRAEKLISLMRNSPLRDCSAELYNSLEAPALKKYPLLVLFQEFLRTNGAIGTLMSGSGSTTFAITESLAAGEKLAEKFCGKFGKGYWVAITSAGY